MSAGLLGSTPAVSVGERVVRIVEAGTNNVTASSAPYCVDPPYAVKDGPAARGVRGNTVALKFLRSAL